MELQVLIHRIPISPLAWTWNWKKRKEKKKITPAQSWTDEDVFIDDVTVDRRGTMNCEVYRAKDSAQTNTTKLMGLYFTV